MEYYVLNSNYHGLSHWVVKKEDLEDFSINLEEQNFGSNVLNSTFDEDKLTVEIEFEYIGKDKHTKKYIFIKAREWTNRR